MRSNNLRILIGELIQATFIRELKNRFISEVELDGHVIECYVPSSCRLSNFFELTGKLVLITPTISQGVRTKYALVAIPYKQSYLLLNSSLANRAIEGAIKSRRFSFLGKRTQILKEHRVESYKTDLFVADSKTIIEVKSIISTNKSAVFPTVYSERAIEQLNVLRALLEVGYRACYIIVSLNPYVKEIVIDRNARFFQPFTECLSMGMTIKGFTCRLKDGYIALEKEICITTESKE